MTVDLSEFLPSPEPKFCKVARILSSMDDEHQEKLEAAMGEESIGHVKISLVVKSWGYEISDTAIAAHRRGACRCG